MNIISLNTNQKWWIKVTAASVVLCAVEVCLARKAGSNQPLPKKNHIQQHPSS